MSIEKIERELRERLDRLEDEQPGDEFYFASADIRALLDELSRLRTALVDIRIELIHGDGDTYERITTCKEIVERALSEREGQE
jgi:hypothetical protein